jgi:hypothetical protein
MPKTGFEALLRPRDSVLALIDHQAPSMLAMGPRCCGWISRPTVITFGSAGSNRPRNLRRGRDGSRGPSTSFPRGSGARVV